MANKQICSVDVVDSMTDEDKLLVNIDGKLRQIKVDNIPSKIDPKEINELKSRVDNITSLSEGSTTGDAELQDIRVKADGTTAKNAGNAVREQFNELKSDLVDNISIININNSFITNIDNKYVNSANGVVSDSTDYCCTDFIDVRNRLSNNISFRCTFFGGVGFAVYDIAKTFICGVSADDIGTEDTMPIDYKYTLPQNACYIRISMRNIFYKDIDSYKLKCFMGMADNKYVVSVGASLPNYNILRVLKETPNDVPIYVMAGIHNIKACYEEFYGLDYFTNYAGASNEDVFSYGLHITSGRKIYMSPKAEIHFMYDGDNIHVKTEFSVFNFGWDAEIHGGTIYFHGCRYAIHDDSGYEAGTNIIDGVVFDGQPIYQAVVGGGCGAENTYIIKDCLFLNNDQPYDITYHNNAGSTSKNKIIIKNCYGNKGVRFWYLGTSTNITNCIVNSCHFDSCEIGAHPQYPDAVQNMQLYAWCNEFTN